MPEMRTCTKCGIEKELNKDNFGVRNKNPVVFRADCKECLKAYRESVKGKPTPGKLKREQEAEGKRICSKCGEKKELNAENFSAFTYKGEPRFRADCLACSRKRCRANTLQYKLNNSDKVKAQERAYYLKNKDVLSAKHKEYYSENRDKMLERDKRRRANVAALKKKKKHNREAAEGRLCSVCGIKKELTADNFFRHRRGFKASCKECDGLKAKVRNRMRKEKNSERCRKYWAKNKDRFLEKNRIRSRIYYHEHKEKIQKYRCRPEVKEHYRLFLKQYRNYPEVKARYRKYSVEYSGRPEVIQKRKEYYWRPEVQKRVKEYRARADVKEHRKLWNKQYHQRPEIKKRRKKYNERPEVKERRRIYRQKYQKTARAKELHKQYLQKPEVQARYRTYYRRYYLNNLNYINSKRALRRKQNPCLRMREAVSRRVHAELKTQGVSKNGLSCWSKLGYTPQELKQHLESLFEPWMSWLNGPKVYNIESWDDNDSSTWVWQVDHIIPQSSLPYTSMNHPNFKKCWALENLRPYSAKQNVIDGARNA